MAIIRITDISEFNDTIKTEINSNRFIEILAEEYGYIAKDIDDAILYYNRVNNSIGNEFYLSNAEYIN